MKRSTIIFILVLLSLFQCKAPDPVSEQEVLAVLEKWRQSFLKKDAVQLEQVLDDTWVYSGNIDGTRSTKKQAIHELENAEYSFLDISYFDVTVDLFDQVAIIRGKERMTILGSSSDTTIVQLSFTDVYQKKQGVVKAISTHSSLLE